VEDKILTIGDLHYQASRKRAIKLAEESILSGIKKHKFNRIILLGDLFHKKPTAEERCMLAGFLNRLRKHTKNLDFIIGNGKHTFESEAIHEQDWIDLCRDFSQHEELKINNFIFGHYEVKGTRYINGHLSASEKEVEPKLIYLLGHIHSGECSFKNINYVGSLYKVTFSEINDQKRIAIIAKGKIQWINIDSRPMYELELSGKAGKVKARGLKELQATGDTDIDLKIKASSDGESLCAIHRVIFKIKKDYKIEYYQEDIKIKELKTDIPENLDQTVLLKNFCKQKKVPFGLIETELKK